MALVLLLSHRAMAGDVVRTPRLVSERTVDCHSIDSIIGGIIRPGMTPRQRAEAVYEFVRAYRWHWAPAVEGDDRKNFEYGMVNDPVKLLNVYGYGYCFQCAPLLESLYQAAGLEARVCGIGGHVICEVFYDGAFHFYDADQQGYCMLADGKTVAGMEQLSLDPVNLILEQKHKSAPYFPAGDNPRVPYESRIMSAAAFASRDNNYSRHDKTDIGHRMDISLAPGMRYVRRFQPNGAWSYRYGEIEGDLKNGYVDAEKGPTDPFTGMTYGNGSLLWQPDLSGNSDEYPAGVWEDRNIVRDAAGLKPGEPNLPAYSVFRVRLPYVIVGWPTSWTEDKPVGAGLVSADFTDCRDTNYPAISVSTDGGRTWTKVWTNASPADVVHADCDLSARVAGRYEYLLRIDLAGGGSTGGCRLARLSLLTNFQLNPASLPAVGDGNTRMRFLLGDQTETTEIATDLSGPAGFLADIQAMRDVRLGKSGMTPLSGRLTSVGDRIGEVVYELAPPKSGAIRGFSGVIGVRREPGCFNYRDEIKVYYAENEPKKWKLIAQDDYPVVAEHWSCLMPVRADCADDVERVFVKIALRTADNASVQMVKFRLHWRPRADDNAMPARGVRVEHGWTEGDVPRSFTTVIKDAPAEYVVPAGTNVVNRYVIIEPVRAAAESWRPNDPAFSPPQLPKPELVDVKLRDELQALCRNVDKDPDKYLPAAVKSEIGWLAGSAQQVVDMRKTKYPLAEISFRDAVLVRAREVLNQPELRPGQRKPTIGIARMVKEARPSAVQPAEEAGAMFDRMKTTTDPIHRSLLAAGVLLLGDNRGAAPLVEAIGDLPPRVNADPLAVLLITGQPGGKEMFARVLESPDSFLKQQYLDDLVWAGVRDAPERNLIGVLGDRSLWVRLNALQLCRGRKSRALRSAVAHVAKNDPLQCVRDEAVSVLAAMR
jgi:hypothetical protein